MSLDKNCEAIDLKIVTCTLYPLPLLSTNQKIVIYHFLNALLFPIHQNKILLMTDSNGKKLGTFIFSKLSPLEEYFSRANISSLQCTILFKLIKANYYYQNNNKKKHIKQYLIYHSNKFCFSVFALLIIINFYSFHFYAFIIIL